MKVVYRKQRISHKNSSVCMVYEYLMGDKDINGAVVELTGRYPTNGYAVNLKCKEMVYLIKGQGKLVVEGKEVSLKEGDLVLINEGEKYYWDGRMTLFVPCTPAWYPEQHKEVK